MQHRADARDVAARCWHRLLQGHRVLDDALEQKPMHRVLHDKAPSHGYFAALQRRCRPHAPCLAVLTCCCEQRGPRTPRTGSI